MRTPSGSASFLRVVPRTHRSVTVSSPKGICKMRQFQTQTLRAQPLANSEAKCLGGADTRFLPRSAASLLHLRCIKLLHQASAAAVEVSSPQKAPCRIVWAAGSQHRVKNDMRTANSSSMRRLHARRFYSQRCLTIANAPRTESASK